jgi:hypothetical protein
VSKGRALARQGVRGEVRGAAASLAQTEISGRRASVFWGAGLVHAGKGEPGARAGLLGAFMRPR